MAIHFRTKSLLAIILLLLLEACNNNEVIQTPVPVPLPKNPCNSNFEYGYTDKSSYFPGEKVTAFLQSNASVQSCRLDIYDINGRVALSFASPLFAQTVATNASENGYGFLPTTSFVIPDELPSGIYLIEQQIPIVVKTRLQVDLMVVYPENTSNAYETSGGKSLYSADRPGKVSFLRPISLQSNSNYCLKWFSTLKDVSVGYITDRDLDYFSSIEKAKIIVIPGHSEYWTHVARENFDRFVDTKGHALVLSGNTMWWQVRYSADKNSLICYKDRNLDPIEDESLKTINWSENSLSYLIVKSIGADFNRGGYGLKADNGWDGYKIVNNRSPLLEGLNMKQGEVLKLPSGEYDGAPIKSFDNDGYPIIDEDELKFTKVEIIGFDKGVRFDKETYGTFIIFQKAPTSGVIINAASYDWCSEKGMGGVDGDRIKTITNNAITKLLKGETVFSK